MDRGEAFLQISRGVLRKRYGVMGVAAVAVGVVGLCCFRRPLAFPEITYIRGIAHPPTHPLSVPVPLSTETCVYRGVSSNQIFSRFGAIQVQPVGRNFAAVQTIYFSEC